MAKSICMKSLGFLVLVTTMLLVVGCNKTKSWYGNDWYYQSDRERCNLKGNVKMLVDTIFYVHDMLGEIVKDSCYVSNIIKYDKWGNEIYREHYNNEYMEFGEKYIYECSIEQEKNKKTCQYKINGKTEECWVYAYDKKQLLVKFDKFKADSLLSRHVFAYDDVDRLVSVTIYLGDGEKLIKRTMNYDTDSVTVEEFLTYEYRLTKYTLDGKLQECLVYDYDSEDFEKGDLRSKTVYSDDGSSTEYAYDYSGDLEKIISRLCDDHGYFVKETTMDDEWNKEEEKTWKISYDKAGNIVESIEYLNGEPKYLQKVTYTYY